MTVFNQIKNSFELKIGCKQIFPCLVRIYKLQPLCPPTATDRSVYSGNAVGEIESRIKGNIQPLDHQSEYSLILYNSDTKKTPPKQHMEFPYLEDTSWNVTGLVLKSPNFHGLYQTQGIHWERWIEGQLRFLSWPGFIGKLEIWDRGQRGEVMKAMSQTRSDLINPHRLASQANNLQGVLLHEPHIEAIGSHPVVPLTHHPTVFKSLACCLSVHLKPCVLC